MTDNNYEIIKGEGSHNELEVYKQCFINNGSERNIDNLKWLHQQNIACTNIIYYAIENEHTSVAAIYTALPVISTVKNLSVKALQSIDTLTDKSHRGKGLFILLAEKLYKDATDNGFAYVYGFPNENSAHGFFKKLGWVSFGEAPFLIKPLRIKYLIKKIFNLKYTGREVLPPSDSSFFINKTLVIKPIEEFKEDYESIWEVVAGEIKVGVKRTSTYMNWRFVNKPGEVYYKYGIYNNERLEAIIVFTLKNKHDGFVAYIMEFIHQPDKVENAKKLLSFTTKFLNSQKADVILAWCLPQSFNFNVFKKCGYYTLPVRFRPQKLFWGVKILNLKLSEVVLNKNNWYISYADSDTV